MKKVKVLCQFAVEVEMTDDEYERRHFIIEENGCIGTGIVGSKVDRIMDDAAESGYCWSCSLGGECKIIEDSSRDDDFPVHSE